MKKLKILVVNIILFFILFHIVDFCCSLTPLYDWYYKDYNGIKLVKYIKDYRMIHKYSIKFDEKLANELILTDKYCNRKDASPKWGAYRPIENKNAKNSILIFGCSFAYGDYLSNQETFSYRLGKYLSNYTIYNRAQSGWTTSHILYQLENKNFSDIKNLKYVIYVFISPHFIRNKNNYCNIQTPYYRNTKYDFLKLQKYTLKNINSPVESVLKTKYKDKLQMQLYNNKITKELKSDIDLTKNILLSSKSILDYEHKGVKFIILRYDRGESESYNYMFEELEKEGFIVLSVNNLSKTDYNTMPYWISKLNLHPNAKAWSEITPLFVKYMRDRGYFKD